MVCPLIKWQKRRWLLTGAERSFKSNTKTEHFSN
jgi:hypothetical protein